ncbi:hypothetical protein AAF712_011578 [Marasmius tenuissimus]|uniref:Uncharacterized protein n=1 Tax=Marasmius tenuissimus TaxID=585030 RepID=A0ABR2ZK37_9AGAR
MPNNPPCLVCDCPEYIHDPDIAGAICGCEHAELEHGQRPPPPPPPSLPPKGGIPGRCEGWYLAGGIPSTKSVCSRPGCGAKWFLHHPPPNSTPSLSGISSTVPSATPRLVGPWQAPTRSAATTSALGTATSSVLGSTPWVKTRQINVPRDGRVTNHEILEGINGRHTSTLPAPNRFVTAANQVKESKSSSRKHTDYDPCFRQSDNWVQNFQVILLPATDSTIFPPEHSHAFSQKNRPNFKLCIGQLEEQLESISLFGLSFPLTVQAHSKTANIFPALYSAIYNHCQSKGLTPEKIGFPAIPPSTPSSSPLLMCHLGNKVGGKITVKQSMLITNNDWMLEKLSQTTGGGEIPLSVERRQVVFFSFKRPLMGPLRDSLIHPCHVYHFLNTQRPFEGKETYDVDCLPSCPQLSNPPSPTSELSALTSSGSSSSPLVQQRSDSLSSIESFQPRQRQRRESDAEYVPSRSSTPAFPIIIATRSSVPPPVEPPAVIPLAPTPAPELTVAPVPSATPVTQPGILPVLTENSGAPTPPLVDHFASLMAQEVSWITSSRLWRTSIVNQCTQDVGLSVDALSIEDAALALIEKVHRHHSGDPLPFPEGVDVRTFNFDRLLTGDKYCRIGRIQGEQRPGYGTGPLQAVVRKAIQIITSNGLYFKPYGGDIVTWAFQSETSPACQVFARTTGTLLALHLICLRSTAHPVYAGIYLLLARGFTYCMAPERIAKIDANLGTDLYFWTSLQDRNPAALGNPASIIHQLIATHMTRTSLSEINACDDPAIWEGITKELYASALFKTFQHNLSDNSPDLVALREGFNLPLDGIDRKFLWAFSDENTASVIGGMLGRRLEDVQALLDHLDFGQQVDPLMDSLKGQLKVYLEGNGHPQSLVADGFFASENIPAEDEETFRAEKFLEACTGNRLEPASQSWMIRVNFRQPEPVAPVIRRSKETNEDFQARQDAARNAPHVHPPTVKFKQCSTTVIFYRSPWLVQRLQGVSATATEGEYSQDLERFFHLAFVSQGGMLEYTTG